MKKKLYILPWFFGMLLPLFTVSCDKDDDEQAPALDLTVDNSAVTLLQGDCIDVNITSGNKGYYTKSFDETLATAEVSDEIVTITALPDSDLGEEAMAETTILVLDSRKKVARVNVRIAKVWDLTTDVPEEGLDMFIGEIATVKILTGNGDYAVALAEGGEEIVGVGEITGQVFAVRALKEGSTTLTLTDKKGKSVEFPITVNIVELSLDKNECAFEEPDSAPIAVNIEQGNGNYTFAYSVEGIAEATELNNIITITPKKAGETVITVKDQLDREQTIAVTVGTYSLATDKTNGLMLGGTKAAGTVTILKGNGGYAVELSEADQKIATATIDGNTVNVTAAGDFGTAHLKISDAEGKSVEIPVTVTRMAAVLSSDYCFYMDTKSYADRRPELKNLKQVTYEILFYPTYSRSLMSFIGLEGNFLLRLSGDGDINQKFEIATMIYKNGVSGEKYNDPRFRSEQIMFSDRTDMGQKNPGKWYHIAVVFDATQSSVREAYKMYINGVEEPLTAVSGDYADAKPNDHIDLSMVNGDPGMMIGRSGNSEWRFGYMNIHEARVWKTARTGEQIREGMNGLQSDSYEADDLVAHWVFSDGVNTTMFEDRTGNELNAKVCKAGKDFNKDEVVTIPSNRFIGLEWPLF